MQFQNLSEFPALSNPRSVALFECWQLLQKAAYKRSEIPQRRQGPVYLHRSFKGYFKASHDLSPI